MNVASDVGGLAFFLYMFIYAMMSFILPSMMASSIINNFRYDENTNEQSYDNMDTFKDKGDKEEHLDSLQNRLRTFLARIVLHEKDLPTFQRNFWNIKYFKISFCSAFMADMFCCCCMKKKSSVKMYKAGKT